MHILLTDVLTCPRCGPEFGLIVLADALDDRRVVEGRLGCANCREEYPIRGGVVDLRHAAVPPSPPPEPAGKEVADRAIRTAALLGVGEGSGPVLVRSADAELVGEIAGMLPHAQVFGASAAPPGRESPPGVDWLLHGERLPFRSGSLRGIALLDGGALALLDEAARLLARGARLVVDPAPAGTGEALSRRGLEPLLEQDEVAVASNPGGR